MPRHVRLLTTGGTISTKVDPKTGHSAPTLGPEVGRLAGVEGVVVSVEEVTSQPSWMFDPPEMARIARRAAAAAEDATTSGVVVTHGTTTLEYTAFLVDLFLQAETPVVLTGSMRRADDAAPDGPSNLHDALLVASSPEARGLGGLVVFAGKILAGGHVWKARRSEDDAFVDLRGRLVGTVRDGNVDISDRPSRPGSFSGEIEPRVSFVKVTPGTSGDAIVAAARSPIMGMVIEALPGSGGIPPKALTAVREVAQRIPVVIASRAPFGRQSDIPVGGTGEPLEGISLLSAGRLSAEQSWLLLMVVLAETNRDGSDLRERFAAVAGHR